MVSIISKGNIHCMRKAVYFIVPGLILLGLLGFFLYNRISKIVPKNPSTLVGNTPCNLMNGGRFCEVDGIIYFSNPYDGGKLYSMSTACTDVKFLSTDNASSINVAGDYIYYVRTNASVDSNPTLLLDDNLFGIVRMTTKGSRATTLFPGYCNDMSLYGNSLIFNANKSATEVTYTLPIRGGDTTLIAEQNYDNASIRDNLVYFSDNTIDNSIYTMDISDGTIMMNYAAESRQATLYGNYIYYIDISSNNCLMRVDLATRTANLVTNESVVAYNVYNDTVYFSSDDSHALKRIKSDGSECETIVEGDISSIYCTSRYTFFSFADSDNLYRVETEGDPTVLTFTIRIK